MNSINKHTHSDLEIKVAEKYRALGFEVILQPQSTDLPFDLGNYRPDLLVKKSLTEGYIIEIKSSISRISVDRYREVAEKVSKHPGWSFLLVTEEDVSQSLKEKDVNELLTENQMLERKARAENLISLGETEGAFILLFGILEATLRHQAKKVSIPIERFPTTSLIKHLYSQGELSMDQFDKAQELLAIRNRFVHGYQTDNLDEPTRCIQALVEELLKLIHENIV